MLIKIMLSVGVVIFFLWFLSCFAKRLNLVDTPDHRKEHEGEIPLVGGLAVFVSLTLIPLFFNEIPQKLEWMLVGAAPLVLVGAIDDSRPLTAWVRLIVQLIATLIPLGLGGLWLESTNLRAPFLDSFGVLGHVITILLVISVINAFNMIDGIDGLASGVMLVSLVSLIVSQLLFSNVILHSGWTLVLFMSVLTFFLVNLTVIPMNKVFLGDSGSTLLGFILSWFIIYLAQNPYTEINLWAVSWVLLLPLGNLGSVVWSRIAERRSPFSPDRLHLHHLLTDLGFGPLGVLGILLGYTLLSSTTGNLLVLIFNAEVGFVALIWAFLVHIFVQQRLARVVKQKRVLPEVRV